MVGIKNRLVTIRLTRSQKDIIQLAAAYRGVTFNQFLTDTGYQEAIRVVKEEEQLNISQKTAEYFFAMLGGNAERSDKLKVLAAKFAESKKGNGTYQHPVIKRLR